MARLYRETGDFAKALPLLERSLEITEKTYGPESPGMASTFHDMAVLYHVMGEDTKASPLYETLHAMGTLAAARGRPHEARAHFEGALAMLRERLGEGHPKALRTAAAVAAL
eukprot:tig00021179_g19274.t1